MADDQSLDADAQSLDGQVDALEARCTALNASLARTRITSLALLLATAGLVAIVAGTFFRMGSHLLSERNQEELALLAQKRLAARSEDYLREIGKLIDKTSPRLTTAFYDRSKKDLPRYMEAVQAHREPLLKNIETRLHDAVMKREAELLESKRQILVEAFPAIKDEKLQAAMIVNLQLAVEKLIKKHYLDYLHGEVVALCDHLDTFPPAEIPSGKNAPSVEDQLTASLMELLSTKLTQPPAAVSTE